MAAITSSPSVIQVANFETSPKIDVEAVKTIILEHGLEDIPVVAVAVAGNARTGKTFLLNSMVVYLERMSDSAVEPFEASSVISGMQWEGGLDGVTKGMWLWKKPYKIDRKDGSKVAILLFDTQGIDDGLNSADSKVDKQIIFVALSMATIYIHNVQKIWRLSERKIYQIFKSFNDLYGDGVQNGETLFNSFTLLFRDWSHDKGFGCRTDVFMRELENCRRNQEAFKILNGIDNLFQRKTAWVLPEPSQALINCQGSISVADIGPDFLNSIVTFFSALFSLHGHYNKHMESALTGKRFIKLLEGLSARLQEWPELAGEAEQLKDIYLSKAYDSAKEHFKNLSKKVETTEDMKAINALLEDASHSARKKFENLSQRIDPSDILFCRYYGKMLKEIKQERKSCISMANLRIEQRKNEKAEKDMKELRNRVENIRQQLQTTRNTLEMKMMLQTQQHEEDKKQQAQNVKLRTQVGLVLSSAAVGLMAGPLVVPAVVGVAGIGAAGVGAAGGAAFALTSVALKEGTEMLLETASTVKEYVPGDHSMKKKQ